ncbi:MAG: hypothetical protein JXR77_05265 [Lentisphaeria bacterium]|nr:hypothetical protein [Lentisphaeria bacterium]
MNDRFRAYLDTVTAGLRDDPELRLDVEQELAGHLEDKAEALRREGMSAEESVVQATAAFGEPVEMAAELESGNRGRLVFRARVRRCLRWLPVPGAVVAAVVCSDLQLGVAMSMSRQLGGKVSGPSGPFPGWFQRHAERLLGVDSDAPVLRCTPAELWQENPGNACYYANYVTHEVAPKVTNPAALPSAPPSPSPPSTHEVAPKVTNPAAGAGSDAEDQREKLLADLAAAETVDPDNARYDYLRAALLLRDACSIETKGRTGGKPGAPPPELTWTIHDRALLDRAMAHMVAGLRKPSFRRYGQEMLTEKLRALGPPRRLVQQIQRTAIAAGVLLPDLGSMRQLGRASVLYGDLLAREGRAEEAVPFLEGWEALAVHLNGDAWTLVDMLVVTAVADAFPEEAARIYERLGQPEEAERVRGNGALLAAPGREWRRQRTGEDDPEEQRQRERELVLYGSALSRALLPAVGEWPSRQDYAVSRRLEYVVIMEALLAAVNGLLLLAMAACLLVALRWRFAAGGAAIPVLLLPGWRQTASFLLSSVVLPVAVFALWVTILPVSGQAYSVAAARHKVIAEFCLLVAVLLVLPAWLGGRAVARRCRELGIAVPRFPARGLLVVLAAPAVLTFAAWVVPASPSPPPGWLLFAPVLLGVFLVLTAIVTFARFLAGSPRYGLYWGSVARSLIPGFAAAVLTLCLLARPTLLHSERHCLATDPILGTMTDGGTAGFTQVETRVVNRFREQVSQAITQLR